MDPRITVIAQLVDISPTETNHSRRPVASEVAAAVGQANLDLKNLCKKVSKYPKQTTFAAKIKPKLIKLNFTKSLQSYFVSYRTQMYSDINKVE